MQRCHIYLRNDAVYVVSYSREKGGPWMAMGPMFKVGSLGPREIGEAVITALNASRDDMPPLADFKSVQKAFYSFLEVKRWSDVVRTATCAGAERESDMITVSGDQVADDGGFEPDGTSFESASTSPEHVGRAVLKGLKLPDIA